MCIKRSITFEVSGFRKKNHLLQRDFIFLNLFELQTFCVFKMHHSKPQHQFSTLFDFICYFSCIYWLFWAIRLWNWKAFKMNSERFQVGMVSSFHPHSMCEKVERVTAKTGCTSCTKWTISFEVWGFHTETRLLQRDFIFLNLFEHHSFSMFKMHHTKPHHQFSTLSDYICYFSCNYWLFWAIRPWNWKAFQMNSEKVESWHGIIIWPT